MKKKVLFLGFCFVIILLVFTTGCKKDFEIIGQWTLTYNDPYAAKAPGISDHATVLLPNQAKAGVRAYTLIFTGTKESGIYTSVENPSCVGGTYTVADRAVTIIDNLCDKITFTGTASDDNDTVTGTLISISNGYTGAFTMNRIGEQ